MSLMRKEPWRHALSFHQLQIFDKVILVGLIREAVDSV
jgi:hypothetical protein